MHSAREHPTVVQAYLGKECALGRMLGPFPVGERSSLECVKVTGRPFPYVGGAAGYPMVWYLTSDFLVVLSQHVNVNCVIRPDNHVILYQFVSSISGLPVRACACRAALPLCHMIVAIQRSDWVTRFPNMLTQHNRQTLFFVKEAREGLGPRLH